MRHITWHIMRCTIGLSRPHTWKASTHAMPLSEHDDVSLVEDRQAVAERPGLRHIVTMQNSLPT